ncbi:Z band alternatively spliced PDZ-motif protein 52 isoform X2 [Arctopsyche grandis]|uniref:Z band alternatively spliced PDZ-motif protein 52 isoform X2 n=1 Tax=Arctopsyche grandis TaxID=121162 RepID=UPI00406D6436
MAQLLNIRLNRPESCPLGFRLQGGKDFGTPLVIQKVNGGSPAEKAGLQAGDSVIKVNTTDVFNLRHKEAQDVIVRAGQNFDITVQRGGSTWKPSVTPVGALPTPAGGKSFNSMSPVTQTSLKANNQPAQNIGSGYNNAAKPFNYMNGNGDSVKSIVNKQYNTPVGIYSEETIAETLSAQAEVLAGGVLGVNFKKNEKIYDSEKSEVFKMLQEADNEPEPETSHFYSTASHVRTASPLPLAHRPRHTQPPPIVRVCHGTQTPIPEEPAITMHLYPEPLHRPSIPVGCHQVLPGGQIQLGAPSPTPDTTEPLGPVADTPTCSNCNEHIVGVFVRIKDKNLHVECFKCATCGSSLKNQGYYNLNGKLYCDIHAKMVARQNPPAPNLDPVTILPKLPSSTISSALSSHSVPLPPLSNPIPPAFSGNGPSPFSPTGDQTDNSLTLKLENVEAFASLLTNGDAEKNNNNVVTQSLSNSCTNPNQSSNINNYNTLEKNESLNKKNIGIVSDAKSTNGMSHLHNVNSPVSFNNMLNTTNSVYKKVIPPHMGGQYKPSNNISGPKPFGAPISPVAPLSACSISPRSVPSVASAPISPASTLQRPIQQALVAQPLPDEANNTQEMNAKLLSDAMKNGITRNTLMRQLAKNAFDGNFEIGIQRKIKPGDHISNMASKIKDTVVMKHPLNNSTITNSAIEASKYPKGNTENGIHNYNHMNGLNLNMNNETCRKQEPPAPQIVFTCGTVPPPPPLPKIKQEYQNLTPQKTNGNAFSSPSLSQSSSPLTSLSGSGSLSPSYDKQTTHQADSNIPPRQLTSALLNKMLLKDIINKEKVETENKSPKSFSNLNVNRNIAESFELKNDKQTKLKINNDENIIPYNVANMSLESNEVVNLVNGDKTENNNDFPVQLREKKRNLIDDKKSGKRDSHIVTRPLSTIASVDIVDKSNPVCTQCNKQITRGPFISALGRIWCPEHFVCVNNTCRRHLQDIGFVEENGQLYCEYCFEQFIAPACDKCHAKIKGDCLNAIGKHFHPECFCCAYCGKLFGNNPFFLEEGLPYCEADWNELFTTKCFACGFPVEAGDRCAKKISKDRVSTPREDVHSAKTMLANSYTENIIASSPYTTDQIYQLSNETTDFTNMNISPNFQSDRGIFSDILSTTGKVLGTVTMDTIHSSTVCDITDTPITDDLTAIENDALYSDGGITPKSICDTMRTETYTNEDVLRIKLAPTLIEFDEYLLGRNTPNIDNTFMKCLTPSLVSQTITYESNSRRTTPEIFHRYGENNSSGIIYKSDVVVEESSSLPLFMMNNSKEYTIKTMLNNLSVTDNLKEVEENSIQKQINEIDIKSDHTKTEQVINHNTQTENRSETKPTTSKAKNQVSQSKISKLKSTILNMPIHYHAAIICFFLVLYNVLFNIYKQNVDKSNSLFA